MQSASSPMVRGAPVVNRRNEIFHEARFHGEPLGFEVSEEADAVLREMAAVLCRVLAALLGVARQGTPGSVAFSWSLSR